MATSDDAYPEIPPQNPNQPTNYKPAKLLYSHFLYKSLVVAVLLLLPLFPSSQSPEFINRNIFTRSWELVHLIFVGIAVSYGLFSRRINLHTDKENHRPPIENTHTYVSRILQASSFLDDDTENLSGSYSQDTKNWSRRYVRQDPGILDEENCNEDSAAAIRSCSSCGSKQQLLLPVRSLRSDKAVNSNRYSRSLNRSTSLNLNKNSSGTLDSVDLEEKLKGNVVLPSPIPWRSRSARTAKQEAGGVVNSLPPSIDKSSCWSSPVITASSNVSPPSPPRSPEIRAKNIYRSPPPPPPPPPPPTQRPFVYQRPPSTTRRPSSSTCTYVFPSQRSSSTSSVNNSEELKDLCRNSSCSSKDAAVSNGKLRLDPMKLEAQSTTMMMKKNVNPSAAATREKDPVVKTRKVKEFKGDDKEIEQQVYLKEKKGSKKAGGGGCETVNSFEKKSKEIAEKFVILDPYEEEDSDGEADHHEHNQVTGSSNPVQETNNTSSASTAGGSGIAISDEDANEVDKKADEFIARFREQIRLQRIESIKRSSRQHNLRNSAG